MPQSVHSFSSLPSLLVGSEVDSKLKSPAKELSGGEASDGLVMSAVMVEGDKWQQECCKFASLLEGPLS